MRPLVAGALSVGSDAAETGGHASRLQVESETLQAETLNEAQSRPNDHPVACALLCGYCP